MVVRQNSEAYGTLVGNRDQDQLPACQLSSAPSTTLAVNMVQGKTKGLQAKAGNARHAAKAASSTKKGKRSIPPKKASLVKQAQMHQSLSAKINKSIETQMVAAASSGKLTIMRNANADAAPAASGSSAKKLKS